MQAMQIQAPMNPVHILTDKDVGGEKLTGRLCLLLDAIDLTMSLRVFHEERVLY